LQGTDGNSNSNGIGARVEVYVDADHKMIREIRSGDGFEYMGSLNAYFGLGDIQQVSSLRVKWPSGTVDVIENPAINGMLSIEEGAFPLKVDEAGNSLFSLYPNPAKDVLTITGSLDIANANIYDLTGRLVKAVDVKNAMIPVQQLAKGTYIIILHDTNGKSHSSKFIKE
jgi:ASPIC and UnbV/Secretion system C-terminal sorting domain